ncbi:phage terminase small subunit [Kushneria phyllosphaerae]|uniref:Phage small terminase subunit n=1 Tax=Kushneria phyllosphaerae TaxID=2100822 RepID=A0A2R8CKL2_9GAMM|nr:phage terminase small subunit [Kushneria phyllosphaerae]SPJ33415.1 hypothetical protein KSP9073_01424 [Kushneria phyllosphaerae]
MNSPARRHYQRVTAARAAGDAEPGQPQHGEQFELMAAALWEARRTLKAIRSREAKIAKKRELLPQFDDYVAGVLEGGNGAQDVVVMTVMVWRIDTGDLDGALAIAEYAMRHGLDTPDHYERDTASLITEEVAESALRSMDREEEASQHAERAARLSLILARTEALTREADMHDEIRAKLYKAWGQAARARGNHDAEALEHLRRALELNDRAGVKKDIEKLERELKQQNNGSPGA